MAAVVLKKQTVSHMENDMERWLKQRESLRRKLDKFIKKRDKAVGDKEVNHITSVSLLI